MKNGVESSTSGNAFPKTRKVLNDSGLTGEPATSGVTGRRSNPGLIPVAASQRRGYLNGVIVFPNLSASSEMAEMSEMMPVLRNRIPTRGGDSP